MAVSTQGLQVLREIRTEAPNRRFLQSWDRSARVLRFGCGDAERGVLVGSDGSVDVAASSRPTKLQSPTVERFLQGAAANSPLLDVRQVLQAYVHLPDPRLYMLFATWIMGTYVYSLFSHFGYLFLYSETPRCGKTRAEEITSHLAFEATTPRNAPTPPSMRETAVDGGTAIFDTLERWKDKSTESFAAAMELLDAGFRSGGVVTKMVSTGTGDWRQEIYQVYAPYMFAAISKDSLTDTALDRSFVVQMARKSTKVKTRPYDARCENECVPIREKLYLAALAHASEIAAVYESTDLQRHVDGLGLNDRAADIWKPLLAIASAFGEEDVFNGLSALVQEMSPDPDRREERRQLSIVRALRLVCGQEGTLTGTTQQIVGAVEQTTNVECADLHGVLSGWGFEERSKRLAGIETPRRAWEISDAELARVERSLAGGDPDELRTTTTTEPGEAPEGPTEPAAEQA